MEKFIIFLLSMSPVSELRGSIPLGVFYYKLGILETVLISLLGNILISLIILLTLNYTLSYLFKLSPPLKKIADWVFSFTKKHHQKKFNKWENLALVVIVAIPLPFTGAWTGSLASYVFGIPAKKAFPLIVLGISIAALIVTTLTINGIYIFQ